MRTTTIIIAALLSLLSSCAAMEGKTDGRRAQIRAGVSSLETAHFDAGTLPTLSAEVEVIEMVEDTLVGVAAFDVAYGSSDDSVGGTNFDLDASRLGGRLGLRWRPGKGWGYKLMPVAGAGVGFVDAEIDATPAGGGATVNERERDVGGYLEAGLDYKVGKSVWVTFMYQYIDYNTVRSQALLLGLGFSF